MSETEAGVVENTKPVPQEKAPEKSAKRKGDVDDLHRLLREAEIASETANGILREAQAKALDLQEEVQRRRAALDDALGVTSGPEKNLSLHDLNQHRIEREKEERATKDQALNIATDALKGAFGTRPTGNKTDSRRSRRKLKGAENA